ncbi:MAG: efflux RND transporter periplasmic adaptor subunit [Candidatus Eisenbacteria bacterium]|nr:efflux RND transporter periplasmic adaptor subunit [Candidatus Eisenbacteria bacterium]
MKKKILIIAAAVIVILVFVVANLKRSSGKTIDVQTTTVKRGEITQLVRASGSVEPRTIVKLSASVPGQVTKIHVKEGDSVTKGQLLLKLDDTQYRSQLNSGEAELQSAEASLRLSAANLERSRQALERKKALSERSLVSPEELEAIQTQFNVDKAQKDVAEERVSQAKANLRAARDYLDKTVFTSPIDGVISQLNIEEGEIAITGTMNNPGTVMLTVADLSVMEVKADVDETDVVHVTNGQPVKITVDAIRDTTFKGTVTEVASTAKVSGFGTEREEVNFEVTVEVTDKVPQLRPGMTADVEITTGVAKNVLSVPIQAVVVKTKKDIESEKAALEKVKSKKKAKNPKKSDETDKDKEKDKEINGVFVVEKGIAKFHEVKTLLSGDTNIEVAGSIKEGDKIISGPFKTLRNLKEGAKVKEAGEGKKKEKKS